MPDDHSALEHLKNGSSSEKRAAFRLIYDTYQGPVMRYLSSKTRTREDAEEIFSNTWVVAAKKLSIFEQRTNTKSENPLQAWLLEIADRKRKEYYRKQHDNELPLDTADLSLLEHQIYPSSTTPESTTTSFRQELIDKLNAAVSKLKDIDQKIINLRYDKQMSFAEIGNRLEMTENNVRIRHHRLIKKLQKKFQNEEQ